MIVKPAYAGIGRRSLPDDIRNFMTRFAYVSAAKGYMLRSGGAAGADDAFEQGARYYAKEQGLPLSDVMQIFLPYSSFNGRSAFNDGYHNYSDFLQTDALRARVMQLVDGIHPAPHKLKRARPMMERNCMQILGPDLVSPSEFVICWTHDGDANTGGTGFAKKLALRHDIRIVELLCEDQRAEIEGGLEGMEVVRFLSR